jgi:hypothetical protein
MSFTHSNDGLDTYNCLAELYKRLFENKENLGVKDFQKIFSNVGISTNFIFADIDGNIGFFFLLLKFFFFNFF